MGSARATPDEDTPARARARGLAWTVAALGLATAAFLGLLALGWAPLPAALLPYGAGLTASGWALGVAWHRARDEAAGRAAAQADLARSEQRCRSLLEGFEYEVRVLLDQGGRFLTWNAAAQALLGHTEAEALGQPYAILFSRMDREDALPDRVLAEAARAGHQTEGWRRKKDGTLFLADEQVRVTRGARGETSGYAVRLCDVTSKRQEEATRRREAEVHAHATTQEEAHRLKSLFLARIAHELRTPAWAVSSIADLLAGPIAPADDARLRAEIQAASGHLLQLVDNVFDLNRAELRRLEFRPEPVDVAELVRSAGEGFRPAAVSAGHTLRVEVVPVEGVRLDPTRLRQVLYNYLSNAARYTPPGGSLVVRVGPDGPNHLRLEVEDNGPGIPPAELPRLFHEFQQLGGAVSGQRPPGQESGVGIGLALTRHIVEAQGGRVGVRPASPSGAVFFAVLPRLPRVPTNPTTPVLPGAAGTVLVVEDDPEAARFYADALARHHVEVLPADTGEAALEVIGSRAVDLALIDLVLPDMSGIDLARSLHQLPGLAFLPILLVTGARGVATDASPEVRAVLRKPVRIEDLDRALARCGLPVSPTSRDTPP